MATFTVFAYTLGIKFYSLEPSNSYKTSEPDNGSEDKTRWACNARCTIIETHSVFNKEANLRYQWYPEHVLYNTFPS